MRYWILLFLCVANLYAEPFGNAKVTKATGNVIKGNASIETASNSLVQLEFPDGTIARVGSNARFRFIPGSREAILDGGTLLFSLPRDVGGVIVKAGPVFVTATEGDFQLSNVSGQSKVICLNGKVIAALSSNLKGSAKLKPGQMVSVPAGTTKMPESTAINLQTLISTSGLMKMGTLPSQSRIEANARKQKGAPAISVPLSNATQTAQGVNQIIAQQEAEQAKQLAAQQAAQQQAQQAAAQQQANNIRLETARQQAVQQAAQQQAQQAAAQQQAVQQQAQRLAQQQAQANQGQGPQGNQGQGIGVGGTPGQGQGNQGNQGQGQGQGQANNP